jgi:serine/threonine protein kinase
MENVCFYFSLSFLDEIKNFIGNGASADVYKCILKDTNTEMAIKVFKPTEDGKPILRDIAIGFNKELDSEYTVKYRDKFTIKCGEKNFQCVVMDLQDSSLDRFLLNRNINEQLLTDDVWSLFF